YFTIRDPEAAPLAAARCQIPSFALSSRKERRRTAWRGLQRTRRTAANRPSAKKQSPSEEQTGDSCGFGDRHQQIVDDHAGLIRSAKNSDLSKIIGGGAVKRYRTGVDLGPINREVISLAAAGAR